MGTCRSDPPGGLRIPDDATEAEAAAVAAAISSYLAGERAAAEAKPTWAGRRWGFAGRLSSLGFDPTRVPDGVPTDGWAAVGRADRF